VTSLDCLGSAKKPNDKKDDKNGSDNAAADVHENLSLKGIGSSSKHDWCELSVHYRTGRSQSWSAS